MQSVIKAAASPPPENPCANFRRALSDYVPVALEEDAELLRDTALFLDAPAAEARQRREYFVQFRSRRVELAVPEHRLDKGARLVVGLWEAWGWGFLRGFFAFFVLYLCVMFEGGAGCVH